VVRDKAVRGRRKDIRNFMVGNIYILSVDNESLFTIRRLNWYF